MRVLRSSLYSRHGAPPLTIVVRDSDVIDTLESIRAGHLQPGALAVHDIFEMEDGTIGDATLAAGERAGERAVEEQHMALLYYWTVMSWEPLGQGGVVYMDKPAPLSREQIATVFEQLAQHPEYKGFRIVSHTRDGERVELRDGKITDPEEG